MKKFAFFCLLLLAALGSVQAAQSRETLTLPAADCNSLNIECGAGDLKVRGVDGLAQIEVIAVLNVKVIANSELPEFRKEHVILKLKKINNEAALTARIESGFWVETLFDGGREASIDLDVRLPRRLALQVNDGSGDSDIRDVDGGVDLEDGSGDIVMASIKGTVKIDDGSGEMKLANLKGRVEIKDGSGDIELKAAGGDVSVEDGSGEIELYNISGSVTIDDGSGDIVIDGVEKDVTIDEAGSGEVKIRNVKGKVRK